MDGFLKIETPALHCEKCGRVIPTNGGVVETQKGAEMISIPRLGCEFCAREAGGVKDKRRITPRRMFTGSRLEDKGQASLFDKLPVEVDPWS